MAQVSVGLKRLFTIFNIFFAIIGGFIIMLALLTQTLSNVNGGNALLSFTPGVIPLYVVGSSTMIIAILGAYGAHNESRGCLIVFLVFMVIGSLVMLCVAIPCVFLRSGLEAKVEDMFRELLPLDKDTSDVRMMTETVQMKLQCCGLFSYKDWENNIPDSCLCSQRDEFEGKCQIVNYQGVLMQGTSVYAKACFPILIHYITLFADVLVGVFFTLTLLALLGLVLSSVMIHQMRFPHRLSMMMSVPAILSPHPPKYEELRNPSKY